MQMPAVKTMPGKFDLDDSTSIATMSWKNFFTDTRLVSLIDTALQNNIDLFMTMQNIEIARSRLLVSKGALLPTVNSVVAGGVEKYGDYTMNGVGNFDTNLSPNINKDQKIPTHPSVDMFLGFRSTWEIDIWGKLRNRKKAAAARLLATEKGRQVVITALVAEIANSYYSLLALDNELAIIRKNILLQQAALEVVRVQKEGGRATELAVQQFNAQLLNTKAIEFPVRQDIVMIENQINILLGRYPQNISRDTAIMSQQIPSILQTGLPSSMLSRRPDIQQAELELVATNADVASARAAFLPSLTISPYVGLNAFKPYLLFNAGSIVYAVAGGLTAPVFNQNQIRADYSIANAQKRNALYTYQKILLNSYSEVMTNLRSIDNNKQAYALKEQEVIQLNDAVSTARDLYVTGYANYLEVITAQKGVLDAELQLTRNKRKLFESVINLYRSLGGGWN